MFNNGRKTIGVILCDVASHYQEQVCHTISSYAKNAGYNIAYFTYYTCYGADTRNGRGEANIIHLVPYAKLDAIIFCHDTLENAGAKDAVEKVWEYIDRFCTCPVITLRHDSGKYPCVLVRQENAVERLVYHFIDDHKMKRLAFMSGPKEHQDSVTRLAEFKRALVNRGISFDDSLVFEGDFWKNRVAEAVSYFTKDLDNMPEAIVCANDYMAIALSNELISRGFLIPEDIAVSGFDDIWESSITMPPITTIAVPVTDMARKALRLIETMWAGGQTDRVNYVDAELKLRNSCGCQTFNMQAMLAKRVRQEKEHTKVLALIQTNTYMFVDLSELDNLDGIENYVRLLDYSDNHVRHFFICLGEGSGNYYPKYRSASPGFAKKTKAVGGVLNRRSVTTEVFDTTELLPPEAAEEEPMIYYFFPLHNNQYSFGYFAISYDGVYSADKTFQNWLAILGNALETIRLKQKNAGLLQELNNLYIHDALTGLYNRRGFDTMSENLFQKAKAEKKSFAIVAIDMDNLKIVNDRFGHMNGDLSLKTIGAAMEAAAREQDICARVGGDEYNMVMPDCTEEEIADVIHKFQAYLDAFNEDSELPYFVRASVGYHLRRPEDVSTLEECINASDAQLYEHKRKRKELCPDSVLRQE